VGVSGLVGLVRRLWRELLGFGVVGAVGYLSDAIVFNALLRHTPSVLASAIAVSISTLVAYVGNRFWTFRARERRQTRAEFGLFVLVSAGGFLITVSCVWFTKYVLGYDSRLAANLAQLGAGQVLGTLFRFWACHTYVFPESTPTGADAVDSGTGQAAVAAPADQYQGTDSLV
jgi:putative flippase GtrA